MHVGDAAARDRHAGEQAVPEGRGGEVGVDAAGLIAPGGLEIPDYDTMAVTPAGFTEPSIHLLSNLQVGVFLTAVAAVIVGMGVGVGVVLFARRDVH